MAENTSSATSIIDDTQQGMRLGMMLGPQGVLTGALVGMQSGVLRNALGQMGLMNENGQQTLEFPPIPGQFGPQQTPSNIRPILDSDTDTPKSGLELTDEQREKLDDFMKSLSDEQKVQFVVETIQANNPSSVHPVQYGMFKGQGIELPDLESSDLGVSNKKVGDPILDHPEYITIRAFENNRPPSIQPGALPAIPALGMVPGITASGLLDKEMGDALSKQFGDDKAGTDVFKDRIAENQRGSVDPRLGVDMNTLDMQQGSNPGMQFA